MNILDDCELRLPRNLVAQAVTEHEKHGMIFADTAALLIEHGADMHRLTEQVWAQAEGTGI
jgi:hypothetical protein